MARAIDFYFDFSSPYGYLAARRVDEVAGRHGRAVIWRPYMLGAAMKLTGARPLVHIPMVSDYALRDLARSARLHGVPFTVPDPFPIAALAPTRLFYWLSDEDPDRARRFARSVFEAYFAEGRDVSDASLCAYLAAGAGADREAALAATRDPALKDRVRRITDEAIARGVFGSPFFFVDDEPFWGHDRLAEVERWLESGGW